MESVHYLLMRAHTRVNQQILAQAAAIGLTPGQPKVLEYLTAHEGSDQKSISVHCEIQPSTTATILAGMEKRGLIERRQAEGNRRSLYVYLTEKGREAARQMNVIFAETEKTALQGLQEEEVAQLKRLLGSILTAMEGKAS